MTTINQSDLSRDAKHLLKDYAPVVLTYLGIVATFGIASFICCLIWLLVWWRCRECVAPRNYQASAKRVGWDVGIPATRGKITN